MANCNGVRRGSTPTNYFDGLPFTLEECAACVITYSQNGEIKFEKELSSLEQTETGIAVTLSQADTLLLLDDYPVEMQIAYRLKDGYADRSEIIRTSVGRILHDGEI